MAQDQPSLLAPEDMNESLMNRRPMPPTFEQLLSPNSPKNRMPMGYLDPMTRPYDFDDIEAKWKAGESLVPEPAVEPILQLPKKVQGLIWNEMHKTWNKIFIVICVFGVLSDPLFLYVPIVRDDMKCLALHLKLKRATFALRSVSDLFYTLDFFFEIFKFYAASKRISMITKSTTNEFNSQTQEGISPERTATSLRNAIKDGIEKEKSTKQTSLFCILIDIFAAIPIPQVITFVIFLKARSLRSSTRMGLNSLILLQFLPRLLRIYLLGKSPSTPTTQMGVWFRAAVFNLLPFVLASHILGAIWYSFGIQRTTACWEYGCQGLNNCKLGMFDCNGNNARRNISLLINAVCNGDSSSETTPFNLDQFNFGIFLDGVQSGVLESTDFWQKLLECFWWGLRNLSSFGSNLQTSSYTLENLFAVIISTSGMLLFIIYLNASVQTYMHFADERAKKLEFKQKMRMFNPDIDLWLYRNGLPAKLKKGIVETVQEYIEEKKDVDVDNILSILPVKHKRPVLQYLRMASLRTVEMLRKLDNERVLEALSGHLKRVTYSEDSYIIREREPIEKMIFITQGSAWSYRTSNRDTIDYSIIKSLTKGDYFGNELLVWAIKSSSSSKFPISKRIVKAQTKVEAFVIRANDLKRVVCEFWWIFSSKLGHLQDFEPKDWEYLAVCSVRENCRHRHAKENNPDIQNWRKRFFNPTHSLELKD